jgi:hypothetical protein
MKHGSSNGPCGTLMSSVLISPEMVDSDQEKAPFLSGASIVEGCSGHKPIDTMFENTSVDYVDNPREGSTPAPVCLTGPMYPHRSL